MLPPRGAKGRHYSRHAISKLFQVPYHMLKPHPEDSMTHMTKSQRFVRTTLRRLQDISQKSLCEQAHLNLQQRCALLNQSNPTAAWSAASLRAEYKRRSITYKKVRPRYGYRKASQIQLKADDQLKFELLKSKVCGGLCAGQEVIFIDEVTFSMKTFKPYAWSSKATNVTQEAHLGSQPCQAVIGAASAS